MGITRPTSRTYLEIINCINWIAWENSLRGTNTDESREILKCNKGKRIYPCRKSLLAIFMKNVMTNEKFSVVKNKHKS